MPLFFQVIAMIGALSAIPLAIWMYRKKYIDIFILGGIGIYVAVFSSMEPMPLFAINSDIFIIRFIIDFLLVQLFSITLVLCVVLLVTILYRKFIKKQ